jgi:hypothetical protein
MRLIRSVFAAVLFAAGLLANGILAAGLLAGLTGTAVAQDQAAGDAALRQWLALVEACANSTSPRLAIVGLDGRSTAASMK